MDLVIIILIIGWFLLTNRKKPNDKTKNQKGRPSAGNPQNPSVLFPENEPLGQEGSSTCSPTLSKGVLTEGEDPCHSEQFVSIEGEDPCHSELFIPIEREAPFRSDSSLQTGDDQEDKTDHAYDMDEIVDDADDTGKEVLRGIIWSEILNKK